MTVRYVERVLVQDLSVAPLELQARPKEGFEILEIGCDGGGTDERLEIQISEEIMTGAMAEAGKGIVCPVPFKHVNPYTLLSTAKSYYPEVPTFKVSEGEKFIIRAFKGTGTAYILYKHLAADQIPERTAPGGSESTVRFVVSSGYTEKTLAAGAREILTLDIPYNPTGIPDFPYKALVPAGLAYDLLGFCCDKGASAAAIVVHGIRMWRRQEAFLAPEQRFVPLEVYPFPVETTQYKPHYLPERIEFVAGEELKIEADVENTDAAAAQYAQVRCACFFLQRRV